MTTRLWVRMVFTGARRLFSARPPGPRAPPVSMPSICVTTRRTDGRSELFCIVRQSRPITGHSSVSRRNTT